MYYIDIFICFIDWFDFDFVVGEIINWMSVILVLEDFGFFDGMMVDSEGMLWVVYWGGVRVIWWNLYNGELLE